MPYCVHCGKNKNQDANFCPNCGNEDLKKNIPVEKKNTDVIYSQTGTATFGR
ncbi:MAG: hypothetical protein H7643_10735, partial [Candidatus Heimdallarchaeota archaeon]|nr:hypothetical protein [Candidatus Heimdallarchaeota archaeon]